MELTQVSMEEHSPMLSVYLYDTNSVQDRLFQRSQPSCSSSGEVGQTMDGKIGQPDKDLPQGSHNENEHMAENPV